ncbi:hypothetical protein BaRGS_00035248 [Batillaria attramentaria]|uniref:Uncharacterized protein n=1 Tax=Batillaria attramentaria TaxID=370345 RepID=A0ABD0JEY5_9CAEN
MFPLGIIHLGYPGKGRSKQAMERERAGGDGRRPSADQSSIVPIGLPSRCDKMEGLIYFLDQKENPMVCDCILGRETLCFSLPSRLAISAPWDASPVYVELSRAPCLMSSMWRRSLDRVCPVIWEVHTF